MDILVCFSFCLQKRLQWKRLKYFSSEHWIGVKAVFKAILFYQKCHIFDVSIAFLKISDSIMDILFVEV